MSYKVNFKYAGFIPKMGKRVLNGLLKNSYAALALQFFVENLPRRFTLAGGRSLGYQRRTNPYIARKKKEKGHNDPLVFSGITRARALSLNHTRLNASAKGGVGQAWLTINAPALNLRRSGRSPNLRKEIETIASREVPPLERYLGTQIENQFTDYKETSQESV